MNLNNKLCSKWQVLSVSLSPVQFDETSVLNGRHDTQYNDIQHNDTQH